MNEIENLKEILDTGKWAYTLKGKEIYFKYLGINNKTDLGYSLHFDLPEPEGDNQLINEDIQKHKSIIDDYALDMYRKVRFRWEEMNLENASTDKLIKARDMIQKELDKRLNQ